LALGFLAVLAGTAGCGDGRFKNEQAFLKQPLATQHEQFVGLPPAKQIQIYLAAQSHEPPDTSFCREIGQSSGRSAVSEIVRFLEAEKEDYAKLDLLRALECVVHAQGPICDRAVWKLATDVAASVKDEEWRRDAENAVRGLQCAEPPSVTRVPTPP
jgi:hypothetical protein